VIHDGVVNDEQSQCRRKYSSNGMMTSSTARRQPEIRYPFGGGDKKSKVLLRDNAFRSPIAVYSRQINQIAQSLILDLLFDAHFDSRATMLADNPKVANLTTSDGFLIAD
jgi:hypothetical protein